MKIKPEQLTRLVLETIRDHAHGRHDLTKAEVVWGLLTEKYPEIDGITTPPRQEKILATYLGEFINTVAKGSYNPSDAPPEGPEFRQSLEHNEVLRNAAHAGSPPPPSVGGKILNALEDLRGDNMASLGLVIAMAMGREQEEAMRIAKLLSAIESKHGTNLSEPPSDKSSKKLPDAYSVDEIQTRLSRGYRGGV